MLLNKTRNEKIIGKVKVADTHWRKMKGLMFEDAKKFDYALIFELGKESRKSSSMHMMFVFFPIDILFLDKDKRIVEIVKNLQPFTPNYTPKKRCWYFVELPAGSTNNVRVGNTLEW